MNKVRWILVVCGVSIVAGLYIFGRVKSYSLATPMPMTAMAGGHAGAPSTVDFSSVLNIATNGLPKSKQDSLQLLDNRLEQATDKNRAIKDLIKFWNTNNEPAVAAKYLMDIAGNTNTAADWANAGDAFNNTFQQTNDTIIRIFAVQQAIECYKNSIGKDSSNLNNQVKLAQCYVDGAGDPMSGVMILKNLEKKDSNNVQVNLLLGRLDIESGQINKAVPRLERLVKNNPTNLEAYFYLGMAYKASGKTDKAIQTFERCRTMVTDPDGQKQIDNIIEQLKKS